MLALRNLKVLLVEDDPELARTVERVLTRYGHITSIASSVAAAEALTGSFDCGILDIDLPDGNGVHLAARMLDAGQVGAVVFYSASSDPDVIAEACELGPFVAKAAGTRELERALGDAVSCAARQVAGSESPPPGPAQRRTKSGSRRKTNGNQ
ncbi:MAG TPA: response regulator [Polyangiaceae bacterium]|nr:response regulator [Polyangiaceae bacterium]